MARKKFKPTWHEGDQDFHEIAFDDGTVAHVTVTHGNPRDVPKVLRDLFFATGIKWDCQGLTAEEIEADIAEADLAGVAI